MSLTVPVVSLLGQLVELTYMRIMAIRVSEPALPVLQSHSFICF